MLVDRAALAAYADQVDDVSEAAGEAAARAVEGYLARNLNAPVSEMREAIIEIVCCAVDAYGGAAGELAASLYDEMAEASGEKTSPAEVTGLTDEAREAIGSRVRYAMRHLVYDGRDDI